MTSFNLLQAKVLVSLFCRSLLAIRLDTAKVRPNNNGLNLFFHKVSQREIIQMAKSLDMTTSKLENLLLECLSSKNVDGFEYQLTERDVGDSSKVFYNMETFYFHTRCARIKFL